MWWLVTQLEHNLPNSSGWFNETWPQTSLCLGLIFNFRKRWEKDGKKMEKRWFAFFGPLFSTLQGGGHVVNPDRRPHLTLVQLYVRAAFLTFLMLLIAAVRMRTGILQTFANFCTLATLQVVEEMFSKFKCLKKQTEMVQKCQFHIFLSKPPTLVVPIQSISQWLSQIAN